MAKPFKDLESRMPPERLARAKQRASEMMAEMLANRETRQDEMAGTESRDERTLGNQPRSGDSQ